MRCERFDLQPGEYLVGLGGRLGDICDQINFTTSTGRTFIAGGSGGNPMACQTPGAVKPYIVAIGAGLGGHVHNFRCYYIDLAANP